MDIREGARLQGNRKGKGKEDSGGGGGGVLGFGSGAIYLSGEYILNLTGKLGNGGKEGKREEGNNLERFLSRGKEVSFTYSVASAAFLKDQTDERINTGPKTGKKKRKLF